MRGSNMKKLIPICIFLACIVPLAWPTNWPIIWPDGWWGVTFKLPTGKTVVQEKHKPPVFKLSQGMLHITPGGKMTFGTIKNITKSSDHILICLVGVNRKEIVIPAKYGTWIDLEAILKEEWVKNLRMGWE